MEYLPTAVQISVTLGALAVPLTGAVATMFWVGDRRQREHIARCTRPDHDELRVRIARAFGPPVRAEAFIDAVVLASILERRRAALYGAVRRLPLALALALLAVVCACACTGLTPPGLRPEPVVYGALVVFGVAVSWCVYDALPYANFLREHGWPRDLEPELRGRDGDETDTLGKSGAAKPET